MEWSDPRTAQWLIVATTAVGLAGLWQWITGWARKGTVAQRSALEIAERRSRRVQNRLDQYFRRTWLGAEINMRLLAAGVSLNTIEFLLVCLVAGTAGYLLADIIVPPWLALAGAAFAVRLCWIYLERQRNKRRDDFIQQLPELARILGNASSAGLAVTTALEMAAQELDDPGGTEMALVTEELRLGQSLEGALANLERRMPSREVGVLIGTLVIQQRSGGDLVRALQEMALTLDARRDLHREVRTLMAGSVFTGQLVVLLGLGSVLLMNLAQPGALDKMATEPLGRLALAASALLFTIGFLLVKRVTKVDV